MKNESVIEPVTAIHQLVSEAREGRNPRVIARLYSGLAQGGEAPALIERLDGAPPTPLSSPGLTRGSGESLPRACR